MRKKKNTAKAKNPNNRFFKIGFFVLLILLAFSVYANYDYYVFKLLISQAYVYTDTLDQLYSDALGNDNFKSYYKNFDQMIISVVTEKIRSINNDRYTYLYTPARYKLSKEVEKADAEETKMLRQSDDTAYLSITNISKYTKDYVYDNREALKEYKNLILDLRSDYGGLLADFYKISDLFLDKGAVIGYEKTRLPFYDITIKSKNEPYFNFDKIIVLQDEDTASAAEGLILSLTQNLDNVTLMGAKTFGKGIGQVTIPLKSGYAVKATIMTLQGPDGTSIHSKGIEPDIVYDDEDIIEAALRLVDGS